MLSTANNGPGYEITPWGPWIFSTPDEGPHVPGRLRKLVLFENSNRLYASKKKNVYCLSDPIRVPTFEVSLSFATISLELEYFSASFLVDASLFFQACQPSWEWPKLTLLALTAQQLSPIPSLIEIDDMLQAAASAAMRMPRLTTMEIWNGQEGFAMLFRYQLTNGRQSAVITCRGTWEFDLRPRVVRAWEAVAVGHRAYETRLVKEVLDASVEIRFHGDAIHHLKLVSEVIRPVSLCRFGWSRHIVASHLLRGVA